MSWLKTAKLHQKGWEDTLGDSQRYILDAYDCRVYITRLSSKITVSVTLSHYSFGTIMWQDFWRFNADEMPKARSTWKKVKTIVSEVFEEFKTGELPTTMLHAYLREAVRFVEIESKPSCRIPYVDWAKKEKGVGDWRSSIYGTRYPKSDGF